MESSRIPENSELKSKGQNTSHWNVLYINGKVLNCRCSKWPCMCHLDICSPSYGQKKGPGVKLAIWLLTTKSQKSTFSRCSLKECNMTLKSSQRVLQLWFRPHSYWRSELGDMSSQSPGTPTQDSFVTPPWESKEKKPFGCSLRRELQKILYGGRWWLPPSLGRGESSVSKCPCLVPTPKGVPEC
jgi:hypothetical protein